MASRFDDSSSEEGDEAPQLDGMTSSDDYKGRPFDGDDGDELDAAPVLEVTRREERRATEGDGTHWPAKEKKLTLLFPPLSPLSFCKIAPRRRRR